jgi:hypothetical protein
MKEKKITAAELMAKLKNDKDYQEKIKRREEERKAFVEILEKNEQSLVELVNQNGFAIKSVWDLVNTNKDYTKILPILIDSLKKDYHPRIKAGIARALAVPQAKKIAWDALLEEYRRTDAEEDITDPNRRGYKDGLAVALSFLMDETRLAVVLDLLQEKKHKGSRLFFLDNLGKYKKNQNVVKVISLLKDDEDLKQMIKEKFH